MIVCTINVCQISSPFLCVPVALSVCVQPFFRVPVCVYMVAVCQRECAALPLCAGDLSACVQFVSGYVHVCSFKLGLQFVSGYVHGSKTTHSRSHLHPSMSCTVVYVYTA